MQRTKSKILSILLSLVMLLSLLPTTALAATYNDVKVNGVSLGDGKYLASNTAATASSSSTEPTTYVAWYKGGVLTLNGYKGTGIVLQGAPAADLIIKLIGDNTIKTTTHEVGIQGNNAAGSITITADSGSNGNLTIDMTNSTRPVFGINGYANSVTITGSADVTIIAEATATNRESYGIKSSKAVSILDSASVSITCRTPNNSGRSDNCNGIYSDTGVTINTDGTIQIDVHDAGKEAGSYGINSMGTLTLTKVGEMTVKWKKSGVNGAPITPSSPSFDSNAYVTNVTTVTNADGTTYYITTYMPKGTTPTTYTVSFDANGGTGTMADVTGVSGEYTLPANGFTAPGGKRFKAWSVGGSEKAVGDKITVTANTTVTAVWEPIPATTYTVSFNANGGTGTMADVTNISGSYTLPTCTFTAPTNKQFKGWATSASGTVITGTSITVSADTTLYAIWTYTGGGGGGSYYAPVVPDMPMLYRGCTGDAVKTLQDKLNALGYNSGSVDGIFGAKTYAAVTAFQKANSLGVDGIVGKLTWGKLYGVSPAMPVETTTVVGRPMVSYGSRGDAVRKLQELLNALGYDCGSVDGIFGSKTKAAVLAFQKANGLGVDGIVGPLTWAKLG